MENNIIAVKAINIECLEVIVVRMKEAKFDKNDLNTLREIMCDLGKQVVES